MKILPFAIILISLVVPGRVFSQDTNTNLYAKSLHKLVMAEEEDLKIVFKSFSTNYYQGDQELCKKDFESIMETNPNAYNQYTLGKHLNTVGNVIGIPAGLVFGYTTGTWIAGAKPNGALGAVSGICWGGAIVLDLIGQSKRRNAVESYNTSDKVEIRVASNEHGVGLAIRF